MAEESRGPGLHSTAILLGWMVDFFGTLTFGFFADNLLALILLMNQQQTFTIETLIQTNADLSQYPAYRIWGIAYGTLFTVLGGWVAVHIAKFGWKRHAFGVGIVSLLSNVPFLFLRSNPLAADWEIVMGFSLAIPAAVIGGFLRHRGFPGRAQKK